MSQGFIYEAQEKALRPYVKDRVIHDLGAGNLYLSTVLMLLGAREVIAVDKEPIHDGDYGYPAKITAGITPVVSLVQDLKQPVAVGFVSWPVNWDIGLADVLRDSELVIYLGCNTDGTACGDRSFWMQMIGREVLAYVPKRGNTLIIYGSKRVLREPLHEEACALDTSTIHEFSDAV